MKLFCTSMHNLLFQKFKQTDSKYFKIHNETCKPNSMFNLRNKLEKIK